MSTPHNEAKQHDIASIVLMPGDPLRAKWIAETYLEDVRQFNSLRNMFGYTGMYNGTSVSVMASGMGGPSLAIYVHELYNHYHVKAIIRLGSAGGYTKKALLNDVVIGHQSISESNFAQLAYGYQQDAFDASPMLNKALINSAQTQNIQLIEGNIHSHDILYQDEEFAHEQDFIDRNCIAAEMESFALFALASRFNKHAACLVTIVQDYLQQEELDAKKRENSMRNMVDIALGSLKEVSKHVE